jgi:hypothetical protein
VLVHSALPPELAAEVDAVLVAAGVDHVASDDRRPVAAGVAAVDSDAVALIGPFRSRDVAETVEATAPAGLAVIAPMATWAGVTRVDEPGCEDPADHRGTVFRLLARDTEVAARVAHEVRATGRRAFVVAGEHEYGSQLDGQLRMADLPRAIDFDDADVVVLCGIEGEPEIELVRSLAPLPVIAFDGAQGAGLGDTRDVLFALPFAPAPELAAPRLFAGLGQARRAAELVVDIVSNGAADRSSVLAAFRRSNAFDHHGDPIDPDVWLWRALPGGELEPERPLAVS